MNVALTLLAALIFTTHLPVPEHAPDQPANFDPDVAAAVRVTTVPAVNACVHVAVQAIPAGVLVTFPLPVPALSTVRILVTANAAVTVRAAVSET